MTKAASVRREKMSVSLSPSSALGFRRPLTQLVKRSLIITNNNTQPVAFKVKTTAPKLYCVRPNSGRVEAGEHVEVSVMLQALKEEPPLNTKCKDKFLIQSTIITPDKETMTLHDIWASPDTNEEGKVHQQKLRVTYLPPEGQVLEEEDENVGPPNIVSVIGGHESDIDTVRQDHNGHEASNDVIQPVPLEQPRRSITPPPHDYGMAREESQEAPAYDESITQEHEPPHRPETPVHLHETPVIITHELAPAEETPEVTVQQEPVLMPASVSAPPAIIVRENPVNEELYAKFRDAEREIDRLRSTIATMAAAPPQLRQRTRALSDSGSTAETDIQTMGPLQQEGVPLQVVVIIALGVFITTYLFF
ncbi:uncharacterized protein LACBIDRAFT_292494 [Laccaria bicolor S238N-H82]|uniref:Predicted protein n=1 Tax=Laccaria bicolor (strain S238N-H82 / ATCC MYA-4686) TaxID=486041 RepID=B0CV32_LACBS|nr:uncharacterized protein LACBIDRAFT_292494 [Laccaria bicolor S238N-H82]EDR13679.1 predicted protein [Laccaria bicolor S238N-H82]|eukprot:XP_001876177.1 predicted protein [Laccaria bicolor S238N-H82]